MLPKVPVCSLIDPAIEIDLISCIFQDFKMIQPTTLSLQKESDVERMQVSLCSVLSQPG